MYSMIPSRGTSRTFNDLGTFGGLMRLLDDMTPVLSSNTGFRTDILDEGDHYCLQAELPGMKKEDIQLDVKDGTLTIQAKHEERRETNESNFVCRERCYGSFCRSFHLDGIDEAGITARFENGVLELQLPKMQPVEPQTHRIEIQ